MDKFLTIAEVSQTLRLKPQTLYKMIKEGEIPAVRVGSQWRIPEEKFQEWINQKLAPRQEDNNG
jgi:excisionase family DNA binding protein